MPWGPQVTGSTVSTGRTSKKRGRGKNGTGHVRQLPSGRWTFQVEVHDPVGRRVNGTRDTEQEANIAGMAVTVDAKRGKLDPGKTTLREVAERWREEKRNDIEASTRAEYDHKMKHLESLMGKRIKDIRAADAQALVTQLADRGLAPSYINRIIGQLGSIIQIAVRDELLPRNWVEDVKRLRAPRRETSAFTPDEVVAFLGEARKHRLYALFYIAVVTGLRKGELIGLHWDDIEEDPFGGAFIHVRRSVVEPGNELIVRDPKTESSIRRVYVREDATAVLQDHRERTEADLREAGFPVDGIVFPSEVGTYLRPKNLHRTFKRLAEKAGVRTEGRALHELRRTSSSLYKRRRTDPYVIARRLGHKDPKVTMGHYMHAYEDEMVDAALTLDELLAPPATRKAAAHRATPNELPTHASASTKEGGDEPRRLAACAVPDGLRFWWAAQDLNL